MKKSFVKFSVLAVVVLMAASACNSGNKYRESDPNLTQKTVDSVMAIAEDSVNAALDSATKAVDMSNPVARKAMDIARKAAQQTMKEVKEGLNDAAKK